MALILKKMYVGYFHVFHELSDPRTDELGLFLMSSPLKPVLVIAAYLYFVYNLGPKLMENRKAFELKAVLVLYNLIQIILNSYITIEAAIEVFYIKDDCDPIDYAWTPRNVFVLKIYHLFFLLKLADLLDTVFFVLRKKYRQVTFLHVYHHCGMFLMMWLVVKFFAGGAGVYTGLVNAFVHSVMYTYYLLTAIDEKWKQSVTFKKAITQVQIIQFLTFIIIYSRMLLRHDCSYPKLAPYFFVPQNFFMLILFSDFYRKAYLKKNTPPAKNITQNGKDVSQ